MSRPKKLLPIGGYNPYIYPMVGWSISEIAVKQWLRAHENGFCDDVKCPCHDENRNQFWIVKIVEKFLMYIDESDDSGEYPDRYVQTDVVGSEEDDDCDEISSFYLTCSFYFDADVVMISKQIISADWDLGKSFCRRLTQHNDIQDPKFMAIKNGHISYQIIKLGPNRKRKSNH